MWEIPGDYSICGLYSRSSTRSSQWQSEKDLFMALTKRGEEQSVWNTIKNSSITNAHIPRESLCQSFIPVEWRAFFSIHVPSRLLSQVKGGGTWSRMIRTSVKYTGNTAGREESREQWGKAMLLEKPYKCHNSFQDTGALRTEIQLENYRTSSVRHILWPHQQGSSIIHGLKLKELQERDPLWGEVHKKTQSQEGTHKQRY